MTRSMVPFVFAMANSSVMPPTMMNVLPGKASMMSSTGIPDTQPPMTNAPANARMPMLIGVSVATVKIAIRATMEIA